MQCNSEKITILICTYNGEEYIEGLLVSILNEVSDNLSIVISDDCSSDLTLWKCKEVFSKFGFENFKIKENRNRGITRNFIEALQYIEGEYIFICDQDDLWIPGRIKLYSDFFCDSNIPHLIFSDAMVVNSSGVLVEESFIQSSCLDVRVLKDDSILMSNCVQGATCCMNLALVKKIEEIIEHHSIDSFIIHDWFIAIIARYFGRIDFIKKPTIKYRQHENNVIGAKKSTLSSTMIYGIINPNTTLNKIKIISKQFSILKSVLGEKYNASFEYIPWLKRNIILFFSRRF